MLGSNPCNWAIIENRWGGKDDVKPAQVSSNPGLLCHLATVSTVSHRNLFY